MSSIDITDEIFNDFSKWCLKLSKPIFSKIERTHKLLMENKLSVILTAESNKFVLSIKGPGDNKTDYLAGVNFIFERMDSGIWGFGITVEDEEVTLENGSKKTLEKQGYGRYLPTIMFYLYENKRILHKDFSDFGQGLRIGIDTDASDGFWESMGMTIGKYSCEKKPARDDSKTGVYCGLEKEFTGVAFVEWANWVYTGKTKGSKKRTKRKSKKRKSKKRKSKKKSKKKN